jgi:hypothetical protein
MRVFEKCWASSVQVLRNEALPNRLGLVLEMIEMKRKQRTTRKRVIGNFWQKNRNPSAKKAKTTPET